MKWRKALRRRCGHFEHAPEGMLTRGEVREIFADLPLARERTDAVLSRWPARHYDEYQMHYTSLTPGALLYFYAEAAGVTALAVLIAERLNAAPEFDRAARMVGHALFQMWDAERTALAASRAAESVRADPARAKSLRDRARRLHAARRRIIDGILAAAADEVKHRAENRRAWARKDAALEA